MKIATHTRTYLSAPAFVAALSALASVAHATPYTAPPLVTEADCPASTTFDSTTPEQAREEIAAAGYWNITDLRKNCDNTWQASAMRDGIESEVLVSADDQVVQAVY